MTMIFPTVEKATLEPSNPFYGLLIQAIDDLLFTQDDFWQDRENYWDDLGQSTSKNEIRDRLESTVGGEPWRYRDIFNGVSPSRVSGGDDRYVFVSSDFTPLAQLYELDDSGDTDRYVPTADDIGLMTSGNPEQDTLFTNNRIFDGGGLSSTDYYEQQVDDDDDTIYVRVFVYSRYDEVPYAWNAASGYSQQQLQLLYFYGNAWRNACESDKDNYEDLLRDYNSAGGGDIDEDYFSGTIERPWEDYKGTKRSYMRPQDLPGILVREIRGETQFQGTDP